MNPFAFIKNIFMRLFSHETVVKLNAGLEAAAPYVKMLLPICEQIATLTPNKTDDEVIAAYHHYGLDKLFDAEQDKGVLLRDLAVNVVKTTVKDPVKSNVLNLAVEMAVAALAQKG